MCQLVTASPTTQHRLMSLHLLGRGVEHLAPYLGSVEDILHRQHGHNSQHLFATAQMHRHDEHFAEHWLQRKLRHLQEEEETTTASL